MKLGTRIVSLAVAGSLLAAPALAAEKQRGDRPVRASSVEQPWLRPEARDLWVASGLIGLAGAGVGYWALGEQRRARTSYSAAYAKDAVSAAEASAGTANLLFAAAGLAAVYGLVLQLVPPETRDPLSLRVRF